MTKNQRLDKAIEIVRQADFLHGEALRMLSGKCPLAAEHITEAQGQNLDAITHMEEAHEKKLRKGLTSSKKGV